MGSQIRVELGGHPFGGKVYYARKKVKPKNQNLEKGILPRFGEVWD
jgi:hypothetical protein